MTVQIGERKAVAARIRNSPFWECDRWTVVAAVVGTVLCGVFNLLPNPIDLPGGQHLNIRLALIVPVIFGVRFGPIVGFVVGAAGTATSDISTYGFFWNWAIGIGLTGFFSGVLPLRGSHAHRAMQWVVAGTALGAFGMIIGTGFAAVTDIWVAHLAPDDAVGAEWIPLVSRNLVWAMPLIVVVLFRPRTLAVPAARMNTSFFGIPDLVWAGACGMIAIVFAAISPGPRGRGRSRSVVMRWLHPLVWTVWFP